MAKFCTKCGKPLEEGQVCDCQATVDTTATVAPTTASASTSSIDFKESGKDCLEVLKGIFVKPVETIKNFVADNKLVAAIIMIVAAALSTGLYTMAYEKAKLASKYYEPKYLNDFFTTSLDNLVKFALIAAIGYLLITVIFKGKTTWKQMVAAVGAGVAAVLCANVINSVLVFVDAEFVSYLASYISTFATFALFLVVYKSIEETAELDKNKLFLGAISLFVLVEAGMDLYAKIFK